MSTSTDAQICFGICMDEDDELPWNAEPFNGDMEEWWLGVHDYKPPFDLFDEKGNFLPGVTREDPRIREYFEHRRQWLDQHPIPVKEVNYCSGDAPMYILAIPSSCLTALRGYPEEFDPSALPALISDADRQAFDAFCQEYLSDTERNGTKWWLSSYWG
jgi:hypothetical protein